MSQDGTDAAGGKAPDEPSEPTAVESPEADSAAGVDESDRAAEPVEDETEAAPSGERLTAILEALLLVVDTPANEETLAAASGAEVREVRKALREMARELDERGSGMELRNAADGWRYYTRTEFAPYVEQLLLGGARSKLTRAALETLAVVAYRQPVSRARVSAVRGVNVDGVMRTLLARGLIAESGTDPETSATQYATTELFLERLGLGSLSELPDLAPLLPDVDVIDDLSATLDSEPRFLKLGTRAAPTDTGTLGRNYMELDD